MREHSYRKTYIFSQIALQDTTSLFFSLSFSRYIIILYTYIFRRVLSASVWRKTVIGETFFVSVFFFVVYTFTIMIMRVAKRSDKILNL